MSHHISTLCGQNAVWGLPQKNEVIPIAGDDLVFLDFLSRPPCGGIIASLLLGGRGRAAQFSFSALTSFGRVYVSYSVMRQQVPKPMNAIAYEGELLAFIVNGDRFVLLALLPRRKPRTDRTVQPPYFNLTT